MERLPDQAIIEGAKIEGAKSDEFVVVRYILIELYAVSLQLVSYMLSLSASKIGALFNFRPERLFARFIELNDRFKSKMTDAVSKFQLAGLEARICKRLEKQFAMEIRDSEERIYSRLQLVEDQLVEAVQRALSGQTQSPS